MTEHFFVPLEVLRLDIRNVLRHEKIGSAQFIRNTLGFTEKQYENLDAENPTVKLASSSAIKGEIKEQSPFKIYIYFVQSCKPHVRNTVQLTTMEHLQQCVEAIQHQTWTSIGTEVIQDTTGCDQRRSLVYTTLKMTHTRKTNTHMWRKCLSSCYEIVFICLA